MPTFEARSALQAALKGARTNASLWLGLPITASLAAWGLLDTDGLRVTAERLVDVQFRARAWAIMLTVSVLLFAAAALAVSPAGRIRLGPQDSRPDFGLLTWLAMLFAAGMGVGLLFWGTAEPLSHFGYAREYLDDHRAATEALRVTVFHWGLHAWAIYAVIGLVIAYFVHRRHTPMLLSRPLLSALGRRGWVRVLGTVVDTLALVAISIGLAGSIALGVYQVVGGLQGLGVDVPADRLARIVLAVLVAAYIAPLTVELGRGMTWLSNAAMLIAALLMAHVLIAGPTAYVMGAVTEQVGLYATTVIAQGFKTYTFFDGITTDWFHDWTLTYMVWWLAWSPFVGIFIARVSRGRTIREFLAGVVLVPTAFSLLWFGTFGAAGFHAVLGGTEDLVAQARQTPDTVTFAVLESLPLSTLTQIGVVIAAFLFIVTSVVSAAFVLGMLSTGGTLNPPTSVKLAWGAVLGALGAVLIVADSIDAVRAVIALGALPFVFIVMLLLVCLLRLLRREAGEERQASSREVPP